MSIFKNVQLSKPKRNVFDLSHERKLSMQMGDLIPILCEEVVPGDTFRMNTEVMVRLAPMLAPMMHRCDVYTHFFFVPLRLVWDEFKDFITGGEDGTAAPVMPYYSIPAGSVTSYLFAGSLPDHMGVAVPTANPAENMKINALPFRAYQTIYNEYYRDQNLQTKVTVLKTSGIDTYYAYNFPIRKRAWEKDYFTSALPWTQRGGEVSLPLGGEYQVNFTPGMQTFVKNVAGTGIDGSFNSTGGGNLQVNATTASIDNADSLSVDLGNGAGVSVNELRRATKLQQWLEKNARGGSRYIEQILSHFGVKSSDARIQRPEYLGGGKSPIVISEVLQTSKAEASAPLGNMAGHGVSVQNSHRFEKFFEEHGLVIGLISVLPKTSYVNGTRRFFWKEDKFEFFWPEFAQLGEQEVLNGEVYTSFANATDRGVFGYQSRYAEYKYIPSTVHGDFRTSMDYWHMSRKFTALPALNASFVQSDPTHRVFAVTTTTVPKLYVQVFNNLQAIRPIPYYNDPSLI